jgi:hypothetical protein
MSRGISLHIGLNFVDPTAYDGWDGELSGCINDANDLRDLASARGFTPTRLIDGEATSGSVVSAINAAAESLQSGDHFLLTYSGHGGQMPDETGQETDGMNETWVLWDRQLLDNELYALWSRFRAGVKIFMLSDSCHSGTVIRAQELNMLLASLPNGQGARKSAIPLRESLAAIDTRKAFYMNAIGAAPRGARPVPVPVLRVMNLESSVNNYLDNRSLYRSIQALAGPRNPDNIQASMLFISGCQDNQYSYDGDNNGFFTGKVLLTWNNGSFQGGHREFFEAVLAQMPPHQTPEFSTLGVRNDTFSAARPFTVMGQTGSNSGDNTSGHQSSGTTPRLDITDSWNLSEGPPRFAVHTGNHQYFYVEFATEAHLFNYAATGRLRTPDNFYGSWADTSIPPRLTGSQYTMPPSVWERLRSAGKIYYRIGSTPQADGWDGLKITFRDTEFNRAPSFRVVSGGTQPNNGSDPVLDNGAGNHLCDLITGQVGEGHENAVFDVKLVQVLLNEVPRNEGGPQSRLIVDGVFGGNTGQAITRFQSFHKLSGETRGTIRPGAETLKQLREFFGFASRESVPVG